MCKKKEKQEVITLTQLYDKIRASKDVYEDARNDCDILLVEGNKTTPLVYPRENNIDSAIEALRIRLENKAGIVSPAKIKFEYILKTDIGTLFSWLKKKTLWEEYIDVTNIVRRNEVFVEDAIKNANQVAQKMKDFKTPNKE